MNNIEKAKEALEAAMTALDAVHHAANHERKVLSEKTMSGHYVKALQELEKVKAHAQHLLERAEAQG
jgi:hypothetical protein